MQLDEDDAADLKVWVTRKLGDISDADPDVLADYVLALIRAEVDDEALKENTTSQLEDFLANRSSDFVHELFEIIGSRSFTDRPRQITSTTSAISLVPFEDQASTPFRSGITSSIPTGPRQQYSSNGSGVHSRKRTLQDTSGLHTGLLGSFGLDERRVKRGRRDGSGTFSRPEPRANGPLEEGANVRHEAMVGEDLIAHGVGDTSNAAFNPSNGLAAMMALQAMGVQIPPRIGSPTHGLQASKSKTPCTDYNVRGLCTRGASCPFDHGANQIIIPPIEYDPSNPFAAIFETASRLSALPFFNVNGGQQQAPPNRGRRSEFSMQGPNYSRNLTTVVVEQIPEENFEEQQVRSFFDVFGPIEHVDMQAYKRLAIVRFATWEAAKAAYESPKAIFNNRFVKVYWYNPNTVPKAKAGSNDVATAAQRFKPAEPEFDRAKFDERTAEAQRKHELREKAQAQSREIERQRLEIETKAHRARKELAQKMRERGIDYLAISPRTETTSNGKKKHHDTDALRAQIAALEDQARELGIDPDAMEDDEPFYEHTNYSPRGRSSYNGRASYRGSYGSDAPPYYGRSTYQGRGHGRYSNFIFNTGPFKGAVHGGGRYNLDFRPKAVRVRAIDGEWDGDKDEALREHLFTVGEFETIETVPADEDGHVVVTFKDRATAEMFFYGTRLVPNAGKLDFAWVSNPKITITDASRNRTGTSLYGISLDNGGSGVNGVARSVLSGGGDDDDYDERWIVT